MFLLFSLFAFILVLFWLWLFSRLFCDVQSRTDFLFIFSSFLIVTNFEIHTLIVDVCVCLSSAVAQYIYLCILCLEPFNNIW